MKRSREEWLELFTKQAISGLSQAQFCKQESLCPKYFNLRKKQLNPQANTKGFVRLEKPSAIDGLQETLTIRYQSIELSLPMTSPEFVSTLVKQLV